MYTFQTQVIVCVDGGSTPGVYKFTNSFFKRAPVGIPQTGGDGSTSENNADWNKTWAASTLFKVAVAFPGVGQRTADAIIDPTGDIQEVTTQGTSGASAPAWNPTTNGTTNDGSAVWTNRGPAQYQIAVGACQPVLTRTLADSKYCSTGPGVGGAGGPEPYCGQPDAVNTDSYTQITVTSTTSPGTYNHTDCELDDGVKNTKDASNANNNGHSPLVTNNPCNTNNNPTTGFANIKHGTRLTFFFNPPTTTPCPAGTFSATMVGGNLEIVYDQFPAPNDNSYGVNAVGWPNGHTFSNLVGSDHAGIQIKDPNGVVKLSFNLDYITATTGTPSGYASRGPFGGDGDILVGTLVPADITFSSSLARNLNNLGYFAGGSQVQGLATANLLVNSPPTVNQVDDYTLTPAAAAAFPNGWDFHDTYFATITAAKLASMGFNPATWTVEPNLDALHNSPAKPCPAGPFDCDDITVGNKTAGSKEVKADVNNISQTQDAFVTGVHLVWPVGTNGALKSIKIGGDVIWTGTDNSGNVTFDLSALAADANKRKIGKHSDEDVKFTFANNVVTTIGSYTATLDFGDCLGKVILP